MELIIAFTILLVIFYLSINWVRKDITYVKSNIDGNTYLVRNTPDKQEGADRIATIRQKCDLLIRHIQENKEKYDERFHLMVKRYTTKGTEFSEKDKISNYTSFTENKGDRLVFCIRQKNDNEEIIDMNTIMFVTIHEMAHIMTKDFGHHDDFWVNFKDLLHVAVELNLYEPEDYSTSPREYCGMNITSNPLFNKNIKSKS
jgi:predicted metal-dependent hydrolase